MPIDSWRESWKPGMDWDQAVDDILYIRQLAGETGRPRTDPTPAQGWPPDDPRADRAVRRPGQLHRGPAPRRRHRVRRERQSGVVHPWWVCDGHGGDWRATDRHRGRRLHHLRREPAQRPQAPSCIHPAATLQYGIPYVQFVEGVGHSSKADETGGRMVMGTGDQWWPLVELLRTVPVAAGIMGSVAGAPAAYALLSHFTVMVKGQSQIFPSGTPVVRRATGETHDKETLGGAQVHVHESGQVDNEAESEEDAFDQIKSFLSYLPNSTSEVAPRVETGDPPDRRPEELLHIIPPNRKQGYDARQLIRHVVDNGDFFEMRRFYGRGVITGFARFDGYSAGVIGSDPMRLAGAMDGDAGDKSAHFLDLCDTFNLPVVILLDMPGFMLGLQSERRASMRRGACAIIAAVEAQVPKVEFIVRKSYGVAADVPHAMGHPHGLNLRFGWPAGEWGGIPIEGGVAAAYRREIEAAPDPEAYREAIEQRLLRLRSPFRAAHHGDVTDLIDPRDTAGWPAGLSRWRSLCWRDWRSSRSEPSAPDGPDGPDSCSRVTIVDARDGRPMSGVTAGLRVVELGDGIAPSYCTKLLADYGAEVIKVELPEGDRWRAAGPFRDDDPSTEGGGLFTFLNTSKQSVTIDWRTADGSELAGRLVEQSDIVVHPFVGEVRSGLGLGYPASDQDGLVEVAVTPYGLDGPYASFQSEPITMAALSGWMFCMGDHDKPPLFPGGPYIEYLSGISAAIGALIAIEVPGHHGLGPGGGRVGVRGGSGSARLRPLAVQLFGELSGAHRRALWAARPPRSIPVPMASSSFRRSGGLESFCESWAARSFPTTSGFSRPSHVWRIAMRSGKRSSTISPRRAAGSCSRRAAVTTSSSRLCRIWPISLVCSHIRSGTFSIDSNDGPLKGVPLPGPPIRFGDGGWRCDPRLLWAVPTVRCWTGSSESGRGDRPAASRRAALMGEHASGALSGLRVVEIAQGWAGPLVGAMCADFGAEVIKVESVRRLDWWRGVAIGDDALTHERSALFNGIDRNKLDVTLDLQSPGGSRPPSRPGPRGRRLGREFHLARTAEAQPDPPGSLGGESGPYLSVDARLRQHRPLAGLPGARHDGRVDVRSSEPHRI